MNMHDNQALITYVTRLGDNALVLGQRLTELVTRAPELEEELANANFALDYIGQARLYYAYAAELEGAGRSEDDYAFLRDAHEFGNLLLVEQPNGHFGDVIARQFLFESYYLLLLEALQDCRDARLAGIAVRAYREIRYHLRHVSQWVIRLGDGTEESHRRMADAIARLWPLTGEAFAADAVDDAVRVAMNGPDLADLKSCWQTAVRAVLREATLPVPDDGWMDNGGRDGSHSEHLGYLLAELQFLQRAYPGASW